MNKLWREAGTVPSLHLTVQRDPNATHDQGSQQHQEAGTSAKAVGDGRKANPAA